MVKLRQVQIDYINTFDVTAVEGRKKFFSCIIEYILGTETYLENGLGENLTRDEGNAIIRNIHDYDNLLLAVLGGWEKEDDD